MTSKPMVSQSVTRRATLQPVAVGNAVIIFCILPYMSCDGNSLGTDQLSFACGVHAWPNLAGPACDNAVCVSRTDSNPDSGLMHICSKYVCRKITLQVLTVLAQIMTLAAMAAEDIVPEESITHEGDKSEPTPDVASDPAKVDTAVNEQPNAEGDNLDPTSGVASDSAKTETAVNEQPSAAGTSSTTKNSNNEGAGRLSEDSAASTTGGENAKTAQAGEVCQVVTDVHRSIADANSCRVQQ